LAPVPDPGVVASMARVRSGRPQPVAELTQGDLILLREDLRLIGEPQSRPVALQPEHELTSDSSLDRFGEENPDSKPPRTTLEGKGEEPQLGCSFMPELRGGFIGWRCRAGIVPINIVAAPFGSA